VTDPGEEASRLDSQLEPDGDVWSFITGLDEDVASLVVVVAVDVG